MYTYESFETFGEFTLLRPIFMTILLVDLLLFLGLLIPNVRNNMINTITVVSLSSISTLVSAQLLFYSAIIVDEIGLGGDPVSFTLFLTIFGLGIINYFVYQITKRKEKKFI